MAFIAGDVPMLALLISWFVDPEREVREVFEVLEVRELLRDSVVALGVSGRSCVD